MKRHILLLALAVLAILMAFSGCGRSAKKAAEAAENVALPPAAPSAVMTGRNAARNAPIESMNFSATEKTALVIENAAAQTQSVEMNPTASPSGFE